MLFSKKRIAPNEKLIAKEDGILGGVLKINNAYDLYLIETTDGNYELQLFMKLQFFFKNESMSKWKESEKLSFVKNWESRVRKIWDGHLLKVTKNKKHIKLVLEFEIQVGGFMLDHWEITVKKVPAGAVFRSYVRPAMKDVVLTESDNAVVIRNVRKSGSYKQITSAHEFGHMIGLDDEYGALFGGVQGKYSSDYSSVMNIGSTVRQRHINQMMAWLNKTLIENNIQ